VCHSVGYEYVYSPTKAGKTIIIHRIDNIKDRNRTEIYKNNTTLILKMLYAALPLGAISEHYFA